MKRVCEIADSKGYHGIGEQIMSSINFDPGIGTFKHEFLYTDFLNVEKKIVVIIEGELSFDEMDHSPEYAAKLKLFIDDKEEYSEYYPYYLKEENKTNTTRDIMENKIDELTVYEIEDSKKPIYQEKK